jgi:MATE family multidrug resistance protein
MGTAQGVLRGCGKQGILMVYNFVGFWLWGVLLGAFLCFKVGMGVKGLWWGIACGDTVTSKLLLCPAGMNTMTCTCMCVCVCSTWTTLLT